MIFRYGNYFHAQNEVSLTIQKRAVYSPRGFKQAVRETWNLQGVLHGVNAADLTVRLNTMLNAYAVNGLDAGLFLDDGVTPTSHVLYSSATLSGVRVIALDYPQGEGAEYTTFRTYSITLEADFPDLSQSLLSFQESLTFLGGGPRFVFLQTLNGQPQRQQVAQQTPYRVVQAGSAVSLSGYPSAANPIWPDAEHRDQRRINLQGPRLAGGVAEFTTEWQYQFESAYALSAQPHAI